MRRKSIKVIRKNRLKTITAENVIDPIEIVIVQVAHETIIITDTHDVIAHDRVNAIDVRKREATVEDIEHGRVHVRQANRVAVPTIRIRQLVLGAVNIVDTIKFFS